MRTRRTPQADIHRRRAVALQNFLRLNDDQFSKQELGISPGYWSRIKSGKATATGGTFVLNLLDAFGRHPEASFLLASDLSIGPAQLQIA